MTKKIFYLFPKKNMHFQDMKAYAHARTQLKRHLGGARINGVPRDSYFSRRAFGVGGAAYPRDALPA